MFIWYLLSFCLVVSCRPLFLVMSYEYHLSALKSAGSYEFLSRNSQNTPFRTPSDPISWEPDFLRTYSNHMNIQYRNILFQVENQKKLMKLFWNNLEKLHFWPLFAHYLDPEILYKKSGSGSFQHLSIHKSFAINQIKLINESLQLSNGPTSRLFFQAIALPFGRE